MRAYSHSSSLKDYVNLPNSIWSVRFDNHQQDKFNIFSIKYTLQSISIVNIIQ